MMTIAPANYFGFQIVPNCAHCNKPSRLTTGEQIYPHRPDLYVKQFWICTCGAYVGCHPGTSHALGLPSNEKLRLAKRAAHAAFDPLWKSGGCSRREAYARLAEWLGLPGKDVHIGHMDVETCKMVVEVCREHRESA